MDIVDIITEAVIFIVRLICTILVILALIGTVNWFISLEPASQLFYGVVFIIAFILSAMLTYYICNR